MLAQLHKESFADCLNEAFHVRQSGSSGLDLKLTEVTVQVKTPRQETFSVSFHGPAQPFLQQGVYQLHNDSLGDLELFLVPIARDQDGYQYEAVFNRLIAAA